MTILPSLLYRPPHRGLEQAFRPSICWQNGLADSIREGAARRALAADFHEALQVAVAPLGEHVLGGLVLEDAEDLGFQGGAGLGLPQEVAEGMDPVGEEAE